MIVVDDTRPSEDWMSVRCRRCGTTWETRPVTVAVLTVPPPCGNCGRRDWVDELGMPVGWGVR